MRYLFFSLWIVAMVAGGCKKVQQKVIIEGVWDLQALYISGNTDVNAMTIALPGYDKPKDCCKYLIDFQKGGDAYGFYYTNDTLNYMVKGAWELKEKNQLFIHLDKYVNGTFTIDRQGTKEFELTTDENKVEILTTPVPMQINIIRH